MELARWPALAMPWLASDDLADSALPPLAPGCPKDSFDAVSPIRIAGLADGVTLRKPSNATRPLSITLSALGTTNVVQWLLDGRLQGESTGAAPIRIEVTQPGEHHITAVASNGPFARIALQVLAR